MFTDTSTLLIIGEIFGVAALVLCYMLYCLISLKKNNSKLKSQLTDAISKSREVKADALEQKNKYKNKMIELKAKQQDELESILSQERSSWESQLNELTEQFELLNKKQQDNINQNQLLLEAKKEIEELSNQMHSLRDSHFLEAAVPTLPLYDEEPEFLDESDDELDAEIEDFAEETDTAMREELSTDSILVHADDETDMPKISSTLNDDDEPDEESDQGEMVDDDEYQAFDDEDNSDDLTEDDTDSLLENTDDTEDEPFIAEEDFDMEDDEDLPLSDTNEDVENIKEPVTLESDKDQLFTETIDDDELSEQYEEDTDESMMDEATDEIHETAEQVENRLDDLEDQEDNEKPILIAEQTSQLDTTETHSLTDEMIDDQADLELPFFDESKEASETDTAHHSDEIIAELDEDSPVEDEEISLDTIDANTLKELPGDGLENLLNKVMGSEVCDENKESLDQHEALTKSGDDDSLLNSMVYDDYFEKSPPTTDEDSTREDDNSDDGTSVNDTAIDAASPEVTDTVKELITKDPQLLEQKASELENRIHEGKNRLKQIKELCEPGDKRTERLNYLMDFVEGKAKKAIALVHENKDQVKYFHALESKLKDTDLIFQMLEQDFETLHEELLTLKQQNDQL